MYSALRSFFVPTARIKASSLGEMFQKQLTFVHMQEWIAHACMGTHDNAWMILPLTITVGIRVCDV